MDLRLLGPVEACLDRRPVDLGRRRERLLLALLLLDVGRMVPVDRLISLLWDEEEPPPATAAQSLQVHVSRLRQILRAAGPGGPRLITHGRGYLIEADPQTIDAHRFRATVEQARQCEPAPEVADQLRDALALWRGPALSGVTSEEQRERLASGLEELRLAAYELLFETEIALGRHDLVTTELIDLVERHPTRERLIGQLLTALHRQGRTHDALTLYRRARGRIVDELGLEPGPELRRLHEELLREEEEPAPQPVLEGLVPAQLPARAGGFTGRDQELGQLDELAQEGVIAVVGGPGIGKTALVLQWAHRMAESFPDGQLFINMRGFDPAGAVRPIDALTYFLRGLGVPAAGVPIDVDAAAALYRSHVARRRMLIVLDNAAGAEHIRALLPGTHKCLVVVTSRDALTGLVAREGARRLTLGALSGEDADGLLARVIGTGRVAAEREMCAELVKACGHMPLALRIAAANIYSQPHSSIAEHVAALTSGERLGALEIEQDASTSVRSAFDRSYDALGDSGREMFRLLGLVPGVDITVEAATALSGRAPGETRALLRHLAEAHLIEPSQAERFEMHDLLRAYAREQEHCGQARAEAVERLYGHYLSKVDSASQWLYPQMLRLPDRVRGPADAFDSAGAAASWLEAEHANLIAAVIHAVEQDMPQTASLLADALRGHLWLYRDITGWYRVASCGLAAARANRDTHAFVAATISLAHVHHCAGHYSDSAEHYRIALTRSREIGWLGAQGTSIGNLAVIQIGLGDLPQAIDLCQESIAIYQQMEQPAGVAVNVGTLGLAYRMAGRLHDAKEALTRAVRLHGESGARSMHVMSLNHLGDTCRELGEADVARRHLDQALELARQLGNRGAEACALHYLAQLHFDLGDTQGCLRLGRNALEISEATTNSFSAAYALIAIGMAHCGEGRAPEAMASFAEALQVSRKAAERHTETEAIAGLAAACLLAGRPDEALDHARAAVSVSRELRYRGCELRAFLVLAQIHARLGEPGQAREFARQALALAQETGNRLGENSARLALTRIG